MPWSPRTVMTRAVRLVDGLEVEERLDLPHRSGGDGGAPVAHPREIAGRVEQAAEALVFGGFAGAGDVNPADVQPDAWRLGRVEAPERDERAARGHLRVATVGIAEAEERGDVPGLAPEHAPSPALDEARRAIDHGRLGLARQLDDEAGDFTPLAHLGGPIDGRVALAERRPDARRRRRVRHFDRRSLRGCGAVRLERRRGGALDPRALVRFAKPREKLGEIVRSVPTALRVQEREERLVHASGAGEPIARQLRHRGLEDRDELGWGVATEELDRGVFARLDAPERLERGRRAEGVDPRDTLVEKRAEREEVAPRVDALAARLLGAHVPELALERALGARLVDGATRLGDAEVGDLHLAFERQKDVLRRDVPMDDAERSHLLVAPPMRVIEPFGDLGRDVDAHLDRGEHLGAPRSRQHAGEVEPVHVLHRDVVGVHGRGPFGGFGALARRLAEVEDLDDVRMREAHRELRLVDEHVDEVLAPRELGQDPLDDEDLLEALDAVALGLEDLGHAALA